MKQLMVIDENSGITVTIPVSDEELASNAVLQNVVKDVFYSAIKSIELILERTHPKRLAIHVTDPSKKSPELVHVRVVGDIDDINL